MNDDSVKKQGGGSMSKLALLRQNRGLKKQDVDIEGAIDGYAQSIDTETMMAEIERNSASVTFIIDGSGSMSGTEACISTEINSFAKRQAQKVYKTTMSLTLFDHEVYPKFEDVDVNLFKPILTWGCTGGTNIYDAIISAVTVQKKANHDLYLIITDGENQNSYHSEEDVKNLILRKRADGSHIFLLYNDLVSYYDTSENYAESLGIDKNNAVNFNREGDGIKIIFQAMERILDSLRSTGTVPTDWAKVISAHAANPTIKAQDIKYLK